MPRWPSSSSPVSRASCGATRPSGWARRAATLGAAVVERLARDDADEDFREHLTFVLTLIGDRGIDTAASSWRKRDPSAKVRGQALFWLGQKAGQRAVAALEGAVADDPDRDVRKKAVFALSQLPKDEGVPKLIALARTHRDPEVRKQAMFWLGQSGDERAVQFFEAGATRRTDVVRPIGVVFDRIDQLRRSVRLGEEGHAGQRALFLRHVAARDDDRQVGVVLPDALQRRFAAQARHGQVEHHGAHRCAMVRQRASASSPLAASRTW